MPEVALRRKPGYNLVFVGSDAQQETRALLKCVDMEGDFLQGPDKGSSCVTADFRQVFEISEGSFYLMCDCLRVYLGKG